VASGFDLDRALAAGVGDADGAWRFIRRFAESCASPIVAGDGCDDDELRAAEARLGFPLPASLRQAYALMGRRDDLTRMQDRLLTPAQLHLDVTGQVLTFRVENQSVAQWGIPLSAVNEPDPPVVFRLDTFRPQTVWRPFLDRVSLACMEMALSEWTLSGNGFADNRELDDETVSALEQQFRRLPMPNYPLWAEPNGRPTRWFCAEGAVLRDDAGVWLWVRASSAEEIAAVRHALPGDWLMVDGG
jgi:hypothetical protein